MTVYIEIGGSERVTICGLVKINVSPSHNIIDLL